MQYNIMSKAGRPKQFDRTEALNKAAQVFWRQGYSATSMDDLGKAMGLNRPSIYNTFGNKEALYRQSLAMFCGQLDSGIEFCLNNNADLRRGLLEFFEQALDVYCASEPGLGCLMVCTAPSEAINSEAVKNDLTSLIKRVDRAFEENLKRARTSGQLEEHCDIKMLAMHLQASLHTIALRARAGESKRSLKKYIDFALGQLPWT